MANQNRKTLNVRNILERGTLNVRNNESFQLSAQLSNSYTRKTYVKCKKYRIKAMQANDSHTLVNIKSSSNKISKSYIYIYMLDDYRSHDIYIVKYKNIL